MASSGKPRIHSAEMTLAEKFSDIPESHDDDNISQGVSEPPLPPYSSTTSDPKSQIDTETHDDNLHLQAITMTRTPVVQRPVEAAAKRDDDLRRARNPQQPPMPTQVAWTAAEAWNNHIRNLNFPKFMYHLVSSMWLCFILYLTWCLLPIHGHWSLTGQSDKVPHQASDLNNFFNDFQGYSECNIRMADLYAPLGHDASQVSHDGYCPRRKDLLEAMSSGGRIGFDAPYFPRGCHYRWYSVEEICMILERFSAVIFVGDDSLQAIYTGLSILLRRDLSHGAVKTWEMDQHTRRQCSCDNQFMSTSCATHLVKSSDDLGTTTAVSAARKGKIETPYLCGARTPHAFLRVTSSPAPPSAIDKFKALTPREKRSNYHPVPVILALSPTTVNAEAAVSSLQEFLALADQSHRKMPMLWIGPPASGHTEIRGRKGNQEIWDFDRQLRQVAEDNDVEVLGMWNATVQANSWDGVRFGEKVALTQAMMVVNWLARLESS
ncbi:hypothetical protein G647_08154 [Cladophialophora carrionii CBS 160.54]|uniref:Uncharacterized protein n=1 Tax=Cladophialophora carrionii CBS 160.54 TaxID=1279043 RepID=V9CZP8_9EURO|nr:uncharacterized protein G647_08154 [Cladophialophora carrionii CBS 160.54]ETI20120.1 hypothetical protein G647_08154 [Cladophialophora carrionii CBS 160.54]